MKGITIIMFAVLLVGTAIIVSEHVAIAYNNKVAEMSSNSGNNQETQQDCGNSCTMSSSNTISGTTSTPTPTPSPTPSPSPTPTSIYLSITTASSTQYYFTGHLITNTGIAIPNAPITFTGELPGEGSQHIDTGTVLTGENGDYLVLVSAHQVGGYITITAHYAGQGPISYAASNATSYIG
jgi:hypothetical protein